MFTMDNLQISNDTGKNKLNDDQQEQVLYWLAAGLKPSAIVDLINEEFRMSYTRPSVIYYKKQYAEEIEKYRKELNETIQDRVPLSNKFIRVRELSEQAEKVKGKDPKEFRLILKDIAEEMNDLQTNININMTEQILLQVVKIITEEVRDPEIVNRIGKRLEGAVNI